MSQSNMNLGEDKGDYIAVLELRNKTQEAEKDSRDDAREAVHFLTDKWGQWEQQVLSKFADRPKFQIDLTKPIIDRIAGDIEQLEFGGSVIPAGGQAEDDIAETYQGMLRTIDNMSGAQDIFKDAARAICGHGYDAIRIVTDWADADAFEQDILIQKIPNAVDRVWLVGVAEATGIQDIEQGFVDTFLSNAEYKRQFPEGDALSVSEAAETNYYENTQDGVYVTDYYYIKRKPKTLHLLSDGSVVDDEKYQPVAQGMAAKGISIVRSRKRDIPTCYMRKLDAGGWLTEEMELPFSYIPVIEFHGNFQTVEKRAVYHGEVKSLMDSQRIYNYSVSREISDGALAPVDKIAMTPKQAKGHEAQNRRLNTSNDAIFLHNNDPDNPRPPFRLGGPQPNPQLIQTSNRAAQDMKEISMSHNPAQGQGITGHSGKAYEILTQQSDTASYKYVKAVKRSVSRAYQIIIDAIPRVYDTVNRQVRLTQPDGKTKFVPINKQVFDNFGNPAGSINDLSQGQYTFRVTAGKSHTTKKGETVEAVSKWASIAPELLQIGGDVVFGAMEEPGMEQIAERIRAEKIRNGEIPESQLTDKEREKIAEEMAAQQANQQPNPIDQATVAAIMAEVQKSQAEIAERQERLAIEQQEQQRKMMETMLKAQKQEADIQKTQSETLENLREATGADAIVSPAVAEAYQDVATDITEGENLRKPIN